MHLLIFMTKEPQCEYLFYLSNQFKTEHISIKHCVKKLCLILSPRPSIILLVFPHPIHHFQSRQAVRWADLSQDALG